MNLEDANTSPAPTEVGVGRHFDFPVVGLGASAGGLAALLRFFEGLPSATGMAYVVILHLSPKHKSNADRVLQGATGMPVRQVNERTAIEPDHVYVVPPTHRLIVEDGHLGLGELPRAKGRHTAIDDFLRTLGQAQKDRSFAIILSGTGADGTVGIRTVREQGGIILVQTPEDAEYESMPRNAIGTGLVDFVLPVAEMPQKLVQLWANAQAIKLPPLKDPDAAVGAGRLGEEPLGEILAALRTRTGHDFAQYKRATVLRRIERRLQVTQLRDLATYRDYLRDHPSETRLLLGDMLIGVTNFFRDRLAFETLERLVIPELFAGRGLEDTVRAWVPACATGEEAYSIAMLLAEAAAELAEPPQILVFATDIDEDAITFARAARYPEPIVADVPPTRLRRFFTKEDGGGYRVNKTLREMVTFAVHNLLKDPPFSRIDLVSCRNFLIYLNRDAQHKALDLLQFALVLDGYLMLGTSESVEDGTAGFASIDKASRIFRRLARPREALLPTLQGPVVVSAPARETSMARVPTPRELHLEMLELFAPPSVIVDERGDIIHSSEHAHRFLQFTSGEPSLNLMKVVQPGLRAQLRSVLYQAMQTLQPAEAKAVRFVRARNAPPVDVRIHPLSDESKARRFALVIFAEHAETDAPPTAVERAPDDAAAMHLEAQLQATRQQLQATVEQYETRNEELIASNEELSAINEELRSATEELETSREELQSINEELATVNQELKTSVEETNTINNDLQNLMAATEIAVLFVDTTLCLKRYTPAARALFNVIPSDLGRPLSDVTNQLEYPRLTEDVQAVLETLRTHATVVQSRSGAWFATRIVPYRTTEDRIRGAVLTFVDITESRRVAREAARNEAYVLRLLEGIEDHVVIALDKDARVTSWNRGATQIFGYPMAEAMGMPFEALFTPADRAAGVPARELETARATGRCDERRWHLRKDGSMVFLTGALASIEADGLHGYAKIARDDTERYRLDERQQEVHAAEVLVRKQSDEQVRIKEEFLATMSHEMRNPLNAILLQTELLLGPSGMTTGDRAVRQAVVAIRQLASTQSRLIDDLLDVSRQRTGKLELRSQLVPLPFIIGDAVGALAPEAVQKKITVVTDLPEGPLIVAADPLRVKQIAWNLLSNAIKFTPPGGRVTVRVTQDGGDARFDVEDTGEGIDPAVLPHVFDLFRQGDSSLRRRHGGLGIGLALAKQLVEMQGGRIRADSPGAGQGARFSVWLPLHIGQTPEAERRDEPPPADADRRALADLSVLIVDDAPDTAFILREVLMRHGAAAQSHASADAALAACRERPFDAIVTDLAMPGTDGLTFIGQVRATTRNSATPVIFMSGYSRPEDIEKARAAGAADYIVKPVRIEAVITAILHAVDTATDPSADD